MAGESLGALTIKFLGDIAEFRTAQQQVLDLSKQTAAQISKSYDSVQQSIKGALIGLTSIASVSFVKGQFDAFVAGAAGLKDMAERTGETVEKLSGLVAVAKVGGHSIEGMETAMLKLTKGMSGADEETKGAGQALAFLGIKARDSAGALRPSGDLMQEIAKKLEQYKDGAGKSAIAMDLFGKSGAQLLPFLKDLAEQGTLQVKVTAEQAEQADQYEKTIRKLTAAKTALHKEISMGVLPVAQQFADALLDLKKRSDGATEAAKGLRENGSIEDWARKGAVGVATLIDGIRVLPVLFEQVMNGLMALGKEFATFQIASTASIAAIASGGMNVGAINIAKEAFAQLGSEFGKFKEGFDAAAGKFTNGSFARALDEQFGKQQSEKVENLRQAFKRLEHGYDEAGKETLKYGAATEDAAKKAKDLATAWQALDSALNELNQKRIQLAFDIDQESLKNDIAALEDVFKRVGGQSLADEITKRQNEALDAYIANAKQRYAELNAFLVDMSAKIDAMPAGSAEKVAAVAKYTKEYEKLLPLQKEIASEESKRSEIIRNATGRVREMTKAYDDNVRTIIRGLEDYQEGIKEAAIDRSVELSLIGKTKEEQEQITIAARTEREIRRLTLELVRLQRDAQGELTVEQRQQNKIAQDALLIKIDNAKKEGEAQSVYAKTRQSLEDQNTLWKSIGETAQGFFEDLFQNGRSAFTNLWQQAKAFFARLAAQLAVKYVLGIDVQGGGAGGIIGSILGGGSGGGGILGGILNGASSFLGLGGIGGGVMAGLIGPGSGLGTALGLGSAIGPPTALAAGGVAGGAGTLGGGIASLLGAIPGWGWVLAGIAAIAATFIKDEKGIKIDNNLTNVGNPSSHFESSAISAFDVSGDIGREAFKPFVQRVQAIDKFIADNMLSEDQLENVRARINQLKNPRWWGFEDESSAKDAIEKASKFFLVQRYSTIFSEIDQGIAAKISAFEGTSEELFTYIGKVLDGFEVLQTLKKELPDLSLTLDQFVELTDQQRQDLSTIAAAIRLTQVDLAAQADAAYKLASGGIVNAFLAQGDALDHLQDQYEAGLVSVNDMASAIQSFGEAAIQAMVAIRQAKDQVDAMIDGGRRSIEMAGLSAEDKQQYLRDEAERARRQIGVETDPEKIRDLVNRIIANSTEVFNALTPEQQRANRDSFLAGLDKLRDEAQTRLNKLNALIADNSATTMQSIGTSLVDAVRQMGTVADKTDKAADKQVTAANTQLDAARTPLVVVIKQDETEVGGLPRVN